MTRGPEPLRSEPLRPETRRTETRSPEPHNPGGSADFSPIASATHSTQDSSTGRDAPPGAEPSAAFQAERVLLIACGALAREVLDLKRQAEGQALDHLDLICLPAQLHNTPERIPGAVREAVASHGEHYRHVKLLYADCGTGGRLAALCDELGIEMLRGPHCYAMFDGLSRFSQRDEMRCFYLTDFLVRQFDAFVWQPLGLDRHPDLREMYFGQYTTLVHLAQVDDPQLASKAEEHAARLGLAFERRLTGYGDLAHDLHRWGAHGGT